MLSTLKVATHLEASNSTNIINISAHMFHLTESLSTCETWEHVSREQVNNYIGDRRLSVPKMNTQLSQTSGASDTL